MTDRPFDDGEKRLLARMAEEVVASNQMRPTTAMAFLDFMTRANPTGADISGPDGSDEGGEVDHVPLFRQVERELRSTGRMRTMTGCLLARFLATHAATGDFRVGASE